MDLNKKIQKRRERMLKDLKRLNIAYHTISCDDCKVNIVCKEAYDLYNTDDDCLAMK